MTINRFLMEYLLEEKFEGNQSAFARELGMNYADFHKIRKRFEDGRLSGQFSEDIWMLLWRHRIDVTGFYDACDQSELGKSIEEQENACRKIQASVASMLQTENRNANNLTELMRSAAAFEDKIQHYICDERFCPRASQEAETCPIRLLHQLAETLKAKYLKQE